MVAVFLPLIPGHEAPKAYFERALKLGRLSHAYLLIGADEQEVARFAHELTRAIYCERHLGCGACAPCSSIGHGNHPSVHFFGPQEGRTYIDIETIRTLCERTHYRSAELQTVVLERAHLLNEPAANALLKTLEEPPGSFVLILTAPSIGSLLPTIVSRCQRVYVTSAEPAPGRLPAAIEELLEDLGRPGFFVKEDPRTRLGRALPGEEGTRGQVRALLDVLLRELRSRFDPADALALDAAVRRVETLLELRLDLDRNLNPDLVLERALRTLRRGP
jgi:DNA polymerase-3 subunit delta'